MDDRHGKGYVHVLTSSDELRIKIPNNGKNDVYLKN
jgi:hypothetical protein